MQTNLADRQPGTGGSTEGSEPIPADAAETPAVVDSVLMATMTVGRLVRHRLDGEQLDPGSFFLLKNLSTTGPMRVTELAGCANLDTSTVSRQVSQLDRAGLIERTPDPADRRAHQVVLTPAGAQLLEEAFRRRRALLSRSLRDWDPSDIADLDRLLSRFVGDLDRINAELEHA